MFNVRQIIRCQKVVCPNVCNRIINSRNNLFISQVRKINTPNDGFQKQGSYEGPGKTTVSILNEEYAGVVNLIDSYAVDGFRLNDNTKILGPCVVFPTQVLLWNVEGPEDITEESLSLFTILDPKIDVLIVGYGDNNTQTGKKQFPVDTRIIMKMRQKGVNMELLTTENAIATYNYLVEEGRVVAAALIPPNHVVVKDQDVVESKDRRKQLYGDPNKSWLGYDRGEHPVTGETMLPKKNHRFTKMVRKLKFHEQKLLRKVDFYNWEASNNLHEAKIMKRYHIQKREEYTLYNKLSREIRDIVRKIKDLDPKSPHRTEMSAAFLEKLYNLGLIPTKWNLELCDKVTASSFCRRRLPVVLVRSRMAESVKSAVSLVESGHVRVGPDTVLDPAFLVPRNLEDFVTWVDTSKIRQHVMNYKDIRDDYDINC